MADMAPLYIYCNLWPYTKNGAILGTLYWALNVYSSAAVLFSKTEYETKGINKQNERKKTNPPPPAYKKGNNEPNSTQAGVKRRYRTALMEAK